MYIGTTKKGVGRISASASWHAEEIMSASGLKEVDVFVVSCAPCPGVATWEWLEDALLAEFRVEYGELPKQNSQGAKKKWNKKLRRMFNQNVINGVLMHFDATK